jgi:uncharacterized delta-60 repeat protein
VTVLRVAALSAVLVVLAAAPAAAAPRAGSLDASFGDGGTVVADIPQVTWWTGMALQPDGSVVVGGYLTEGPGDADTAVVARFTRAGELDLSFGAGGIARVGLPSTSVLTALGLGPGGEIVLGGPAVDSPGHMFVRLTAGGVPDPSFGGDGVVHVDVGYSGQDLNDLVVHGDGAITAVGSTFSRPVGLALRLLRDGRPDPAFEPDGVVAPASTGIPASDFTAVTLDLDGRTVLAGELHPGYDVRAGQVVARPPSYAGGPSGFTRTPLPRYQAFHGSEVAALASGRIVLSGTVTRRPPVPLEWPALSIFSGDLDPLGARIVRPPGLQRATAKGLATDRRGAPVIAASVTDGERAGVGLYRFVGRRLRLDGSFGHASRTSAPIPDDVFLRSLEAAPGHGLVTFASGNAEGGRVALQRFTDTYEQRRPRVRVRQGKCAHRRRRVRVRVRDASPVERVTVSLNGRRVRSGTRRSMLLRIKPHAGRRRLRVAAEDAAGNVRVVSRRVRACPA